MVSDTLIINQQLNAVESYLDQLQYANKLLKAFFKIMSVKRKRECVIIIQGDHGFRELKNASGRELMFMNLNTFYFSDKNYTDLYDGISPVNTFRVVLNKYFCQQLPLLKDSTIFLQTESDGSQGGNN